MQVDNEQVTQANVQGSCAALVELCRALVDAIHANGIELRTVEQANEQRMG